MAYSLITANSVQGAATSTAGGLTTAVNWGATPTNGNLLLVALTFGGNTTVTGPAGWTQAATTTNGVGEQDEIWYRVASGDTTAGPVFTISASVGYVIQQCEVTGFTGTPTLDTTGVNQATGLATVTVTSGAITSNNDFVFAGCGDAEGATAGVTYSPSTATGTGNTFGADISTTNPPKNGQGERDAWSTATTSGQAVGIKFNLSSASHTTLAATIATFKGVVAVAAAGLVSSPQFNEA